MLAEHLKTSEENRNQKWEELFFKMISESSLKIMSEDPQQGPDGWPYLMTETQFTLDIAPDEKIDTSQKIFHWLSTRGIGLVVNPRRTPYPDFVFSYGMIWSFRETGYFIKYNDLNRSSSFELNSNTPITSGAPTSEYLPDYVKEILRNFLIDQGVFGARVLMISTDKVHYDLCFSLESFGNPPEVEHAGILEAIAWFLPPHYSVALVSETGLPTFVEV
jgi:hypothetical protein